MIPILLSGALVLSLFLAVALLVKRADSRVANIHLGLAMFAFANWFLFSLVHPVPLPLQWVWFRLICASYVLMPVLIYFYFLGKTRQLTQDVRYFIHYIPFIVVAIIWGADMGPWSLRGLISIHRTLPNFLVNFPGFIYTGLILIRLRKFDEALKGHYSTVEKRDLRWLKQLLAALTVVLVLDTLNATWAIFSVSYINITPIYAALILAIGFCGFLQPEIFSAENIAEDDTKLVSSKPVGEPRLNQGEGALLNQLLEVMSSQRPYVDPLLSLSKLARLLSVRPQILSRIINVGTGKNFYDFINGYRVRDVKNKLADKETKVSVLDVAFDFGFNSKSTFYLAFKRELGVTPKEFMSGVTNRI